MAEGLPSNARRDKERVFAATRRVEKFYRNRAPGRGRYPANIIPGTFAVKLPSAGISAGSVASPTAAAVNLYLPDGGGGPGMVADTDTMTIYHNLAIAVPSGNHTGYVSWRSGFYYLHSWDGC
jgi:hypothetical protein